MTTTFRAGEVARTLVKEIPVAWVEPEPRRSRAPLALWLPHLTSTKEEYLPILAAGRGRVRRRQL
ncbi:hypothetical protein [Nonomuraea sp. LPB2021202275-12-8]|uniref:hypothetical protein n=1 Tax=Nonomuraea sp. LPB2021202275-12-8 TaxID=3120159 RepID=UPI00300CC991